MAKEDNFNWIERQAVRVLRIVSPRRAALHAHFTAMARDPEYRGTVLAMLSAYGYRSANDGTNSTPWLGGSGSADAEILNDLPALINKSRELGRDDPIGSGLIKTFVNNWIGSGMRAQARTGNTEKSTIHEEVWNELKDRVNRADDMTHAEGQRMIAARILEDGNIFRKATKRRPDDPIWFETIEKDRVRNPFGVRPEGSNQIRDGVEFDKDGIRVAYWISRDHPGETISATTFERVPAELVMHLRLNATRPGQTHGVPVFHAVLQDLRDLDLLILASLKRVQIAACLAVFLESPESTENILQQTANKYGYQLDQKIQPGMIFKTYPNEKVTTLLPNFPTPEFTPFIISLCQRIGAALGVSWQVVLKDFSNSNYSSARTDLLEARQGYKVLQSWLVEKLLNWEWYQVMRDAKERGERRLAGSTDAELRKVFWIPTGWSWVDPLKEAKATETELQNKMTTLRDVWAARGGDWEEGIDQILREEKLWRDKRAKMGLPDEPLKTPVKGAPQPEMPMQPDEMPDDEDDNTEDDPRPGEEGA